MTAIFLVQGFLLVLAMTGSWWWQRRCRNAGWVDVFWTFGTGAAGILGALWPAGGEGAWPARQIAVAVMAGFWAVRLGSHLRHRVLSRPEDARYAGFRADWGADFQRRMFWLLMIQAVAAWPLAAAVAAAAHNPAAGFTLADAAGLCVFAASIAGEALADRQLARFVANPAHRGQVCDSGLWAWSRHPNYFFEFLVWCAWPFFAFNPDGTVWWISLIAPALMYWLLVHVSGIPPLEKVMLASRGDAYRAYQRRTSRFFPLPPRCEASR